MSNLIRNSLFFKLRQDFRGRILSKMFDVICFKFVFTITPVASELCL